MNILLTVPNTIFCILDVFSFGNFGLKSSGFLSITPAKRTRWTNLFDTFDVKYLAAWYIWHGLHRRSPLTLFPALHLVFHICREMLNLLSEYTPNFHEILNISFLKHNVRFRISHCIAHFTFVCKDQHQDPPCSHAWWWWWWRWWWWCCQWWWWWWWWPFSSSTNKII